MKTKVTKTYICDVCGESFRSEEECSEHESKAHTLVGVFLMRAEYDEDNLHASCEQYAMDDMEDYFGVHDLDMIWVQLDEDCHTNICYATKWLSDHEAMKEKFKSAVLKWFNENVPTAIAAIDDMDCYDDDDDEEEEEQCDEESDSI